MNSTDQLVTIANGKQVKIGDTVWIGGRHREITQDVALGTMSDSSFVRLAGEGPVLTMCVFSSKDEAISRIIAFRLEDIEDAERSMKFLRSEIARLEALREKP